MEYGLALLAGSLHKYADDILDTKEPVTGFHLEFVKVLMVTLITLAGSRSPSLTFFFFLNICIYFFLNKIDTDFWKACMPIPFLVFITMVSTYRIPSLQSLLCSLLFLILVGGLMVAENYSFPEEISKKKLIARIGICIVLGYILFLLKDTEVISIIGAISFFGIGYMATSVLYNCKTLLDLVSNGPNELPTKIRTDLLPNLVLAKELVAVLQNRKVGEILV